jgi:SAM-dependent methyltransferase
MGFFMTIPFNTMLRLEHFSDPSFKRLVREVFPHFAQGDADYPSMREGAKVWEVASCVRALREFGAVRSDAEILGVAAGYEHTVFWLTNQVKRVFCTDLYETNAQWKEAAGGMLFEPEMYAYEGYGWNPRRLVVQYMDAMKLRYEDNSFDGVFSCGSIEHFGTLENVAIAMREMGRVLKPGGVAVVATEFRIDGPNTADIGVPGAILFTEQMVRQFVVEESGLKLVDTPDWSTSAATIDCVYPLAEAIKDGIRPRSIAVSHDGFRWTSGLICLRKSS